MEESQKSFKILSDCAKIAEILKNNSSVRGSTMHINVNNNKFIEVLREIEEFVKVRVDLSQTTISIDIGDIEFIFEKSNT